jgi:methionine-rich copper-binding protein CopC
MRTFVGALLAALLMIPSQSGWAMVELDAPTPIQGDVASLFALPAAPANAVRLAHAILVKANPAQDSTITDIPEEVLLIFNDAVGQEFLALAVIDPTGKRVDNHDAKLDFTDHSHLRASVSKLDPGRYTVRYRVLSADGHVVSGKYFFDVLAK